MRIVNRHFAHLLEGYDRIVEYQRQFDDLLVKERARIRALNEQHDQAYQAEMERHRQKLEQIEAAYNRACAAWEKSEQPARQVYERKLVAWRRRLDRAVRRLDAQFAEERASLAADEAHLERAREVGKYLITLPYTLFAELSVGSRIRRKKEALERLRLRRDTIHAMPEPPFRPSSPMPRRAQLPEPPAEPLIVPLPEAQSMLDEWWAALRAAPDWLHNPEREHEGLTGELALLHTLDQALDDSFITIHGVLVHPHQDGDIVVLGGNGVWLLECKHVSGRVRYDGQNWAHEKRTWVEGSRAGSNGSKAWRPKEGEAFNPSAQWENQALSIKKTLNLHVSKEHIPPVSGGIVFTIDETELQITDCLIGWGKIEEWVDRIANMPIDLKYSERDLVACAHHLLNFSHRSENDLTASAIDAAEMIFSNYANALQRFKAKFGLQA